MTKTARKAMNDSVRLLVGLREGCTVECTTTTNWGYRHHWTVHHPDGVKKIGVEWSFVKRAMEAGLVAAGPEKDYQDHRDYTLTPAGREDVSAFPQYDLDELFARRPVRLPPERVQFLENVRVGTDASTDGWVDLIADGSDSDDHFWNVWHCETKRLVLRKPDKESRKTYYVATTDAGRQYLVENAARKSKRKKTTAA